MPRCQLKFLSLNNELDLVENTTPAQSPLFLFLHNYFYGFKRCICLLTVCKRSIQMEDSDYKRKATVRVEVDVLKKIDEK